MSHPVRDQITKIRTKLEVFNEGKAKKLGCVYMQRRKKTYGIHATLLAYG
jgi:hypothetical protein